ncbi:MAG TPA: gas vesicle protein GvpG [Candidatus Limnocylindrales bacterium]
MISLVKGLTWVAQALLDAAERESNDPAAILARLRDLSYKLETGMISESDFDQEEDALLDRLAELQGPSGFGDAGMRR